MARRYFESFMVDGWWVTEEASPRTKWAATAISSDGYTIERHEFATKRAAQAFAKAHVAPTRFPATAPDEDVAEIRSAA